jgi:hypothetical protein
MSDRRPPKRAPITVHQQDDGTWTLTAHAPRDGANRQTSASDLSYPMAAQVFVAMVEAWLHLLARVYPKLFDALVNRLTVHRAGM